MKSILWVGIVLIIVGGFILAYQGITYTTREKILQIGPLQATQQVQKTIPLPPILGAIGLGAGIVLIIIGAKSGN